MDMRFLILSSTRDLRASLLGLLGFAVAAVAGLGPLGRETVALRLRRDSIVHTDRGTDGTALGRRDREGDLRPRRSPESSALALLVKSGLDGEERGRQERATGNGVLDGRDDEQ